MVTSTRLLQVATGILGVVPVLTGSIGMLGLSDPVYAAANVPPDALLDSNLRFFGGVWLGLGIAIYWLIPRIEAQTVCSAWSGPRSSSMRAQSSVAHAWVMGTGSYLPRDRVPSSDGPGLQR